MVEKIDPSEDIDVMHEVDYLRIERMDGDTLWFAGYRDDGPDIHYNAISTVESDDDDVFKEGLTVSTWSEHPDEELGTPAFDTGDRLIHTIEEQTAEPEYVTERVVKQRFWDVDENEYYYAIGLEKVNDSYEVLNEEFMQDNYRIVTDGG